jgi:hypothetical protein
MRLTRLRPYVLGGTIAALGLVAANGVAAATTGHAFVLGRSNTANAATSLSRTTSGAALALRVRRGSPPLSVNSGRLVKHLNADAVAGRSASALSSRVIQYSFPAIANTANARLQLPGLPPGRYLASYAVNMETTVTKMGITCAFHAANGGNVFKVNAFTSPIPGTLSASANASGVLDTRRRTFVLNCYSSPGKFRWATSVPYRSTVTFLRLDSVVSRSGTDGSR